MTGRSLVALRWRMKPQQEDSCSLVSAPTWEMHSIESAALTTYNWYDMERGKHESNIWVEVALMLCVVCSEMSDKIKKKKKIQNPSITVQHSDLPQKRRGRGGGRTSGCKKLWECRATRAFPLTAHQQINSPQSSKWSDKTTNCPTKTDRRSTTFTDCKPFDSRWPLSEEARRHPGKTHGS